MPVPYKGVEDPKKLPSARSRAACRFQSQTIHIHILDFVGGEWEWEWESVAALETYYIPM